MREDLQRHLGVGEEREHDHRHSLFARRRRRSLRGKVGRPRTPGTHIALIRRISGEHLGWDEGTT